MRTILMAIIAAGVLGFAPAAERPAEAQLVFTISVPIAQPGYYYDPYYPAAYQSYFRYYYPSYNWQPSTYYAYSIGTAAAVTPVVSTSTYYSGYPSSYYGYPYAFGYPYSAGIYSGGAAASSYGFPYAGRLTYGLPAYRYIMAGYGWPSTTYYGYGATSPYFTGYYPSSYYGNYYPSTYYATGVYGVW